VPDMLLVLVGVVAGGVVTWVLVHSHMRSHTISQVAEVQARLAGERARGEELERRLEERTREVASLQTRLTDVEKLRAQAEERSEAARRNIEDQRKLLEEARERLHAAFADLSAEALKKSKDDFLQLAEQKIDSQLGQRQTAMDGLVTSLLKELQRYGQQVHDIETKREEAYGGLKSQLELLAIASIALQRETGNLVTALRAPQVRGRWGEVALHRVVELAGMVEYCDYVEQVTVDGEGGRLRPDMIVHLPNGREVIVDAKVPLAAYLDAMAAATDDERQTALARHAQQVRQHMNALATKAYWDEFAKSADFVVMFIPGESFVAAAAHADNTLIEDGMARKVVVASPTTLISLLRAMHYGWRQEQLTKNAEKIRDLGKDLYERLRRFLDHFEKVGASLGRAVSAYNEATGSLESRVLPAARRFRDLGAAGGDEIPALDGVDIQARELSAAELPKQLDVGESSA
jgi:DNA recombination protein RmuC